MKLDPRSLLAIAVMVIIGFSAYALGAQYLDFAVTGYDGPVSNFQDIDHNLDYYYGDVRKSVNVTSAHVYPVSPDIFDIIVATGLRAEVQTVPNILSQELEDTVYRSIVDEEAETNTTTTVQIYRAKCQMGITLTTYEGGLAMIQDVVFWIELNDNSESIFSNAEDRYAYFVEVYNRALPIKEGSMTVIPTAAGSSFDTESLVTEEVPDWLLDAGYTSSASELTSVRFPITVLTAVPIQSGNVRLESYVTYDIGFDVILTAKWVHVADLKVWSWPELPDWLGDFLYAILVIVIVIGVVIVIIKVRGRG